MNSYFKINDKILDICFMFGYITKRFFMTFWSGDL